MTSANNNDGDWNADLAELETLWRASASQPPEPFLTKCLARTRAELAADRHHRAAARFYLTAAAVLLLGWHASLLATWSAANRPPEGKIAPARAARDDRRALLAELTAELAVAPRPDGAAATR